MFWQINQMGNEVLCDFKTQKNPLRNAVDFQMTYACFIFRLPTEFLVRFRRQWIIVHHKRQTLHS